MSETITLKKGEFLLLEGEESQEMYLLVEGQLSVLKGMGEHEREVSKIFPKQLVGEISFLDGEPRSASVLAQSDCKLIVIRRAHFNEVIDNQQDWFKKLALTLCDRLRKASERAKV